MVSPDAAREASRPRYAFPPLIGVTLAVDLPEMAAHAVRLGTRDETWLGPEWTPEPPPMSAESRWGWRSILGDRLVTLDATTGRLGYVWNGRQGDVYPHYETLRDGLLQTWDACVTACDLVPQGPAVTGWSVEYVNRIPRGTVWQELHDLRFCRWLTAPSHGPAPRVPIDIACAWSFGLPLSSGTLRVAIGLESEPAEQAPAALLVTLHAAGGVEGQAETVTDRLDAGRREIVATFRDMMSSEANAYWGAR
jgi:hypothetical protein